MRKKSAIIASAIAAIITTSVLASALQNQAFALLRGGENVRQALAAAGQDLSAARDFLRSQIGTVPTAEDALRSTLQPTPK